MDRRSVLAIGAAGVTAGALAVYLALSRRREPRPSSTSSLSHPAATKEDVAASEARLRKELRAYVNHSHEAKHHRAPKPKTAVSTDAGADDDDADALPPVPALLRAHQKRILVTGGAGFVGSHLVDVLMMQGHLVYVMDNLFTGRRQNFIHWEGHPNFVFFQRDVVEPFFIEVDEIYHMACPASPPHYQYNAIKTIKCSTMGTLNMLGLAKRCKARLLFTSTSEVYGDPEVHPQNESYWGNVNCLGPRACYDEGKRVAETMCMAYHDENGVDVRIARIFNTFGPRMHPDDGRVVSNFIKQALQGSPLTVYGDGQQTRSFQYVSDLVRGLVALMNSDTEVPVNLGNPEEFAIAQFAEEVVRKVAVGGSLVHKPATKDDPRKRRPDISRAKAELGWEPEVRVHDGLDHTIQYFRHELGLARPDDPEPPVVWMPTIPDLHLGCMATRRDPVVYK